MFKTVGYIDGTQYKVSEEVGKTCKVMKVAYINGIIEFYEVRSLDDTQVYARYGASNLNGARGLKRTIDENGGVFDHVKFWGFPNDQEIAPFKLVKKYPQPKRVNEYGVLVYDHYTINTDVTYLK